MRSGNKTVEQASAWKSQLTASFVSSSDLLMLLTISATFASSLLLIASSNGAEGRDVAMRKGT
jgi:hypothetical protein